VQVPELARHPVPDLQVAEDPVHEQTTEGFRPPRQDGREEKPATS